jgi:hypothetical protein
MTQPVLVSPMPQGGARVKKLLAVALVVVVALLILPKVLLGGGGDDAATFDDAASTGTAPAAVSSQTAAPGADRPVHATTDKDPFKVLRADAAAAGAGAAPAAASTATPAAAPIPSAVPLPSITGPVGVPDATNPFPMLSTPTTTPGSTTPTTAPSGVQAGPIPSPVPAAVRTVTLDSVWTDGTGLLAANVRVDDVAYAVTQGQDFAFSYRLLSLDQESACGVFLYGDKRFSLCQGEQVRT